MGELRPVEVYIDLYTKDLSTLQCAELDVDSRVYHIHILDKGRIYELDSSRETLWFKMQSKNVIICKQLEVRDNVGILTLSSEMCYYDGVFDIQFMIQDVSDGKVLHTMPARLAVEKSVLNNKDMTPYIDIDLITRLQQDVLSFQRDLDNLVAPIGTSTIDKILNN